ncbi:MAG TPA: helix-turn-helix transcriptional regulator [Herpetosiphonaceae bacterium]
MSPRRTTILSVEHALLGFLLDAPLHGYELHQRLQEARALGLVWHVKQAQLYALLSRLEADSLIDAEIIPQAMRPPKRLLHLTHEGRSAFTTWLSSPVAHGRDVRIEFLAKLFWAQRQGPAAVQHLLVVQREVTRAHLAALRAVLAAATADQPYPWLVHEFRRGQLEAMLEWLDTCEATLVPALA